MQREKRKFLSKYLSCTKLCNNQIKVLITKKIHIYTRSSKGLYFVMIEPLIQKLKYFDGKYFCNKLTI